MWRKKKNWTHSTFGTLCGWWICWTSPECFHKVLTWTTHPLLLLLAWYWLVKFKWSLAVWIKLALYRVWFQQCHSPILSLFGSSEIFRTIFFLWVNFLRGSPWKEWDWIRPSKVSYRVREMNSEVAMVTGCTYLTQRWLYLQSEIYSSALCVLNPLPSW